MGEVDLFVVPVPFYLVVFTCSSQNTPSQKAPPTSIVAWYPMPYVALDVVGLFPGSLPGKE